MADHAPGAPTFQISATGPYDELVTRGPIVVVARLLNSESPAPPTLGLDCSQTSITRSDYSIRFELRVVPFAQANCANPPQTTFDTLPAGRYAVDIAARDSSGSIVAAQASSIDVLPIAGRCNAWPMIVPQVIVEHQTLSPTQLRQRVQSDAAYAARLGFPMVESQSIRSTDGGPDWALLDYPVLANPTEARVSLEDMGEFRHVWGDGPACSLPPPDVVGPMVEYFSASVQHYFYSSDRYEIAALDAGTIPGWARTGESFLVTRMVGCIPATSDARGVVYRFYGLPETGPGTHFFTRDRAECSAVDRSTAWTYEGVAFWAWTVQADGTCPDPASQVPLYRVWRPFGDSEHRYSADPRIIADMVASGWTAEGAVMCVRRPA